MFRRFPDMVERRFPDGAPVDEQVSVIGGTDGDQTALGIAARDGHTDIARRLLEAGADPDRPIALRGGTALHNTTYFGHPPSSAC